MMIVCSEDYPTAKGKDGDDSQLHTQASLEALTLPELVTLLTEMVSVFSLLPC